MEYYIFKLYQKEKQKCSEVEQGFDRFEPRVKKIVITGLIVMFAACAEVIVTLLLFPNQLWSLLGVIICLIVLFVLFGIVNMDEKQHMNKYVDSHKKKLEILENVLATEFNLHNRQKLEELINIYQQYIDKKKEEESHNFNYFFRFCRCFSDFI